MVFLRNTRKRPPSPPSSSTIPLLSTKTPKTLNPQHETAVVVDKMVAVLADAGCTLINPSGPPCLPSDPRKFRRHLDRVFKSRDGCDVGEFVKGFGVYIQSKENFLRVLSPTKKDGFGTARSASLVRNLLLVPSLQLDILNLLLEKLPEYFDLHQEDSGMLLSLKDDVARLIINQFRWLDFLVDPDVFVDNLMQLLSICPLSLKKEIVGSLPEIVGDQKNKTVVDALKQILQEDSAIIVPVLDSFSNLNLDDQLQEQVAAIALSCIMTIDAEHMPYLLRFLLLSPTSLNVRRIIKQIREQLKFVGFSHAHASQHSKLKGKSLVNNTEASILDALRSSLRFKNKLCQEILNELDCLQIPKEHKIIDIWLLMLIYMNGESMQKSVEKIFKRKVVQYCIQETLFDQCICGNKELAQDYFPSFLSLSEYLLTCKELKAREFGMHMYACLFAEFDDIYSRQEILGALVTHVGSGVNFEVRSALDTIVSMASMYAQELVPLSSHINGILDYLEGFSVDNLHKVYEFFSCLAISARSVSDNFESSIANELLMILRKQVSHPDLKYKKMGIIGILRMVSCLGDADNVTHQCQREKSNSEEAVELLEISMESCKKSPLPLILFFDELATTLELRILHPAVTEWIGKHLAEFENIYLSEIEGGKLPVEGLYCGLEGELWMNLDGDISPICVDILPLASSSMESACFLQTLPANFRLLTTVERLTNQGSLGGIDALLGCPLHLPSFKYLSGADWHSLSGKQKYVVCLSLYYAANWILELLNAFSTQVAGGSQTTTQSTKDEIITKLTKRLRNLFFLDILLNNAIEHFPLSLPEVTFCVEHDESLFLDQSKHLVHLEKNLEHNRSHGSYTAYTPKHNRKHKRMSKSIPESDSKLRQPTILDVLGKAGVLTRQEVVYVDSPDVQSKEQLSKSTEHENPSDSTEHLSTEVSVAFKALNVQRFKFRPLALQCYSILSVSKDYSSCCTDPEAKLPLYLYLLRDFHHKLDYLFPLGKQDLVKCSSFSAGINKKTGDEFLNSIKPFFSSLKRHFHSAVCILKEGDGGCEEHWKAQAVLAGNPDVAGVVLSKSSISAAICKEVLHCFSKMLNIPEIQKEKMILSDLLQSFQPTEKNESFILGIEPCPAPASIEYLYLGSYSFIESVLDIACSFSFMLAFESLLALESIVISVQKVLQCLGGNSKILHSALGSVVYSTLSSKLGTSAEKLLRHNWGNQDPEDNWKSKSERVQKVVRIYLEKSESNSKLLVDLACSALPKVSFRRTTQKDDNHGFPTLCSSTFIIWYRVMHEVNHAILVALVKEAVLLEKCKVGIQPETVEKLLMKLQQSVNVLVSLVNLCRSHDKVAIHANAVKYGGKFINSFLKVFGLLQSNFQVHSELVMQLVKELQKATRTIQTLCSEAKGLKQTNITCKIPSTKKSMERFLFHVKALLHATSSGSIFWMGNLKHKDLTGQEVSSQVYVDDQCANVDRGLEDIAEEDQPDSVANAEDGETE